MKKSQLENLVREALAENENAEIANALKDALGDLGDEIKQNSDDLVQGDEDLNEAGITLAVGLVLSGPEIVKIVGQVTEKLSKLLGNSGATGEKIISIADKLHHILVALIEKPLNLVPGIKKSGKAHNLAIHILNLVVAGLFVKGGITMGAKFAARKFSAASLKAAMNAVKGKEITAYLKNMLGKGDNAHENFQDGKKKGKSRPGRVKRAGASCNGSVTDLRRKAKKYGGEKGKMYHFCANMKAGKKK